MSKVTEDSHSLGQSGDVDIVSVTCHRITVEVSRTCHMTHDTVMTAAATRSQRRAPPVREAGRRLLSARHGGYTDTRTRGDRAFVTRDPRTGHQWRWRPLRVQADLTNTGRVFPESDSGNKCWSRAVARCCGALLWNKRNDGEVKSIC